MASRGARHCSPTCAATAIFLLDYAARKLQACGSRPDRSNLTSPVSTSRALGLKIPWRTSSVMAWACPTAVTSAPSPAAISASISAAPAPRSQKPPRMKQAISADRTHRC